MKAFHFPLEPLRVLRKQKERLAQQRYARCLIASNNAAAQLEKAVRELEAGRDLFRQELAGGLAAARIQHLRLWCMALEIHQHERRAAYNETKRIADLAFQEMTTAMRDREGLDRFHDKARQAHTQEAFREEQKNLDEIAIHLNGTARLLQPITSPTLTSA